MNLWTMHSLNWKKSVLPRRRRLASAALDRGRAVPRRLRCKHRFACEPDLISMIGGRFANLNAQLLRLSRIPNRGSRSG